MDLRLFYFHVTKYKIYIVTSSALDFKQLYVFCKLYPIKQTFLSERVPYLAHIFNYSSQIWLHITISKSVNFRELSEVIFNVMI